MWIKGELKLQAFLSLENVLQMNTFFFSPNALVLESFSGSKAFLTQSELWLCRYPPEMADLANVGSREVGHDNVLPDTSCLVFMIIMERKNESVDKQMCAHACA